MQQTYKIFNMLLLYIMEDIAFVFIIEKKTSIMEGRSRTVTLNAACS